MDYSIACVIVNYNDSYRVEQIVNRALKYDSIAWVIVVDNCSSDNSVDRLSKIKNKKYVLIKSLQNGGYGYGNNIGIEKAYELNAKYILIANPDVYFDEQCIVDMAEKMLRTSDCAIMNAVETYIGNCAWRRTSVILDVISASVVLNFIFRKKRYYPRNKFMGTGLTDVDIIPGNFLLTSTEIMKKYGMYDEEFFLFEEEKVICDKLRTKGYRFCTDLDVSYEHRHENSSRTRIGSLVIGKKRLIKSKTLYLKKYRNLSGIKLALSRIFFAYTIVEMAIYACLRIPYNAILFSFEKINHHKN